MNYKTPEAFRAALEDRLREESKAQRTLPLLRKKAAFSAFLARANKSPHAITLKGGFALLLRTNMQARPSKDMDFVVQSLRSLGMKVTDPESGITLMMEDIISIKMQDYFTFKIDGKPESLEGSGYGSWRFKFTSLIGGRKFESFHIDIALGDAYITPLDRISVTTFEFAGLPPFDVRMISEEQHFAEKLHALTKPRGDVENSRVKDLVDIVIFIQGGLRAEKAAPICKQVFDHRSTHPLPQKLPELPKFWQTNYEAIARQMNLKANYDEALKLLEEYLTEITRAAQQQA